MTDSCEIASWYRCVLTSNGISHSISRSVCQKSPMGTNRRPMNRKRKKPLAIKRLQTAFSLRPDSMASDAWSEQFHQMRS
jgi:hypothetical protein